MNSKCGVQSKRMCESSESHYSLYRAHGLCESGGVRSGLPVPNKPYGSCGRKVTLNLQCLRAQTLCEHGSQSSGFVWTGRWAWALRIPYPILPPSLINHTVSVDVKHHDRRRRRRTTELRSCVNREVGLGLIAYTVLPPSLINHTVSGDVEDHERRR